jgi:hypothetical protein
MFIGSAVQPVGEVLRRSRADQPASMVRGLDWPGNDLVGAERAADEP